MEHKHRVVREEHRVMGTWQLSTRKTSFMRKSIDPEYSRNTS